VSQLHPSVQATCAVQIAGCSVNVVLMVRREEVAEVFIKEADEQEEVQTELETEKTRALSNEDETDLKLALMKLQSRFSGSGNAFLELIPCHGFTEKLVDD